MNRLVGRILAPLAMAAGLFAMQASGQAGAPRATYAAVGSATSMPYGWMDFCRRHADECRVAAEPALDADLGKPQAWRLLQRVNGWVNANIEPVTDMDHHGVADRWSYPDDGKGDCEDYVLLKRRMLINAGFPRQSLLITVVRDDQNEGHAVLTVKSSIGEIVLDNKRDAILPWAETGYRFVKRQSQTDPNVWVEVGPGAPTAVVAAARDRSAR